MGLVVGQQAKAVIGNLGIGRIDVDGIDIAIGEPPIGEVVIEPSNIAVRQAVTRSE